MRFCKFIVILPFLCWGFDVLAQVPEQGTVPEQWQLTLDVIKSKAQTLLVENTGLEVQCRELVDQVQKLQQSIEDQQDKNEQMARLLKERHGRTDQQLRIEELMRTVKTKSQEARVFDEQWGNLKRKKENLDHNIEQLKYMISDIQLHQQAEQEKIQAFREAAQSQGDDQLSRWRKQLEDENKQEVLLENEWGALKVGDKKQNLNLDAINEENKQLEARLDILRLQKLRHMERSSDMALGQANARRYGQLKERKDQLEAKISAYELRLDELRESSLMTLSWPLKKKKLVHKMVQTDAYNNQMREKIKVLREDIDVLRDQVAKLERRVDFVQGKDAKL